VRLRLPYGLAIPAVVFLGLLPLSPLLPVPSQERLVQEEVAKAWDDYLREEAHGNPPGPLASASILPPVRFRVKQSVSLVATTHVHRIKPGLPQYAGRQVAPLSHLTVDSDLLIVG